MGHRQSRHIPPAQQPIRPQDLFPHYDEWRGHYLSLRASCGEIKQIMDFCDEHPGVVNNRQHNLQGSTFLHQAAHHGTSRPVLERFKNLGADPSLRNHQGRTPLDFAIAAGKQETVALLNELFPRDAYDQHKSQLLCAAHRGDFASVVQSLEVRHYLRHVQSHQGWSVLHQAAYHGCSSQLLARLVALGVGQELKTHAGETFRNILQQQHRQHPFLRTATSQALPPLRAGSLVAVDGAKGRVVSVNDDGTVTVEVEAETTARTRDYEKWNLQRLPELAAEVPDPEASTCVGGCGDMIPPTWRLGDNCHHGMCGECWVTWLWSCYRSANLPPRCPVVGCNAVCRVDAQGGYSRNMEYYWQQRRGLLGATGTFAEFWANCHNRILELANVDTRAAGIMELIRNPGNTPAPVAYCNVANSPARRACPHPGCGVVIEYESQCKHMTCYRCGNSFCWLCLRTQQQHQGFSWGISHRCPVAPIQTEAEVRAILNG